METIATSIIREASINLENDTWNLAWFIDLKEMLKKLIQFKIEIYIEGDVYDDDEEISNVGILEGGVEVESLWLAIRGLSSISQSEHSALLGNFFWSCRPKSICFSWNGDIGDKPFFVFLCERLMDTDNTNLNDNQFQWDNDAKEAKMEMVDMSKGWAHNIPREELQIVPNVDYKTFVASLSNFLSTQH